MRLFVCVAFFLVAAAVSPSPKGIHIQPLFDNLRFEAEDGNMNGVQFGTDNTDHTGRGYVTGFQDARSLSINLPAAPGVYTLLLRYRSPFADKTSSVQLPGQAAKDVVLQATGSAWKQLDLGTVTLGGGDRINIVSNWGWYEIDNVELSPAGGAVRFEAEDGSMNGVQFGTDNTDHTGRGYVTNFKDQNSLTINMHTAPGSYVVTMRYRSPFGSKVSAVQLNGQALADVQLSQSAGWTQVKIGTATLSGNDQLTIISNWGYYDVDNVEVAPQSASTHSNIRVEAEDGSMNGVQFGTDNTDHTGRGYVTNFRDQNSLTLNVKGAPGAYAVVLRYRTPTGTKTTTVQFNGAPMGDVVLTSSAGWAQISAGRVLLTGNDQITIVSNWGWYEIDNVEFQPFAGSADNNRKLNRNPVDPQITREARALLTMLQDNYGSKMLSGQQTMASVNWIQNNLNTAPAILGCDFMDYSPSRLEHNAQPSDVETATSWDAKNGVVTFVWHWNAPTCLYNQPGKEWWRGFFTDATCFDVAAALNEGPNGQNYKLLIRDIDAIAMQLKRLSDSRVPVLFRPLHEAEGGWFWWGAKGAGPAVQLYRILFDRITKVHNIHNIVWVWNSVSPDWYVGDNYCDLVSFDSYPLASDHSPQSGTFDKVNQLSSGKKMVAMAENGPIPDPSQCLSVSFLYSYFVTWGDTFLTNNGMDYLRHVFTHPSVVNLNQLPAGWKNR